MNPAKSQLKMLVAEELGRDYEKQAEATHEKMCEHRGGKAAFVHVAGKIGELGAHIDKDLEEGRIEEIVGEPLKVAAYAKQYIKRCIGVCDNLATAAEVAIHRHTGKEIGLMDAAKRALKMRDEESNKLDAYQKALEEGGGNDVDGRALGHPGPTLKSQRLAEDRGEPAANEEPPGEPKEEPPEEPEAKQPKPKKSTTKKKPTTKKADPAKKRLRQPKKKR